MMVFWWQILFRNKQVLQFSMPVALKVAVTGFKIQAQRLINCFEK